MPTATVTWLTLAKSVVETVLGRYSSMGDVYTWTRADDSRTLPLARMAGPELLGTRFAEPGVYGRMGYVCDDEIQAAQ